MFVEKDTRRKSRGPAGQKEGKENRGHRAGKKGSLKRQMRGYNEGKGVGKYDGVRMRSNLVWGVGKAVGDK